MQGRNRGSHFYDTDLRTPCEGWQEAEGGTSWETSADRPRVNRQREGSCCATQQRELGAL